LRDSGIIVFGFFRNLMEKDRSAILRVDVGNRFVGTLIFRIFFRACHLTRIAQSGGDSQFGENIDLEEKP
jgi:hypothetical protein